MRRVFARSKRSLGEANRLSLLESRCRQPTSGPQDDPTKAVNIGVAAHITAASSDGPRYDSSLTIEQRKSHDNGIWLCQNHGKLVDNDTLKYSAVLLREWKRITEQLASLELENPRRTIDENLAPFAKAERLMPALLDEMRRDLAVNPPTREFVLLKKAWVFNGKVTTYYYDEYPDLDDRVRVLENLDLVRNVTFNNTKRFRMSEAFAEYLCAARSSREPELTWDEVNRCVARSEIGSSVLREVLF